MSEWCQNKDCCYKKNQNQIRGTKGHKYYQSNKAHDYYFGMFCSQGCFHNYFREHSRRILDTIGEIKKQTIGVDNAWKIVSEWNGGGNNYFLENKLMGVKHEISRQQAQTPEQIREDYSWSTRPDSEAKPLAIQLGLAS
jgi:hypothetical protein